MYLHNVKMEKIRGCSEAIIIINIIESPISHLVTKEIIIHMINITLYGSFLLASLFSNVFTNVFAHLMLGNCV